MRDFSTLVAGLRAWTFKHDPHVRAAVDLLITDERWLRRRDFVSCCVHTDSRQAWVDWRAAREFISESRATASTTEMAVLELAVAIGSNQYKLSYLNDGQANAVIRAFTVALGQEG